MFNLDNLRLATKSMISLVVISILFALAIGFGAVRLTQTAADYSDLVDHAAPAVVRTVRLNQNLQRLAHAVYFDATLNCSGPDGAECKEIEEEFREVVASSEKAAREAMEIDPDQAKNFEEFWAKFKSIADQMGLALADATQGKNAETTSAMRALEPKIREFTQEVANYNNARIAANKETAKELRTEADQVVRTSVLSGLAALLVGGGFCMWISSAKISAPLVRLSNRMKSLAEGDLSIEIEGQNRSDEIGAMARSVEVFKKAALAKMARDAKEAEEIKVWKKEDEERAAREAEEARQDQIAITSVAEALHRLADGDLVYRIDAVFAPKSEKLRFDFNAAVQKLQQAMLSISASAGGIHSGSGEISAAADDLSRRTEQQAAGLEETAATLDEITATVKTTAEGAIHAQKVVANAKADADKSGEVVRQAIAAMGGIEKSSQQIGQIIGVIDEIAFQTNLLALNAGVEAARAGDAGRGFAVVASEVRALAQRSAEAAKEIKSLISASTAQVSQGVEFVGEAGSALERIVAQVAEINTAVASIAASAQEQATGLHQVNGAVNQMDQVTQQNAAMVEETTAAAHSLSHESEELTRLLSRFQLGQAAAGTASAKPAKAASRPVSAPARASAQAGRPALKNLPGPGRGAAVRKAEAAAAEDSWEEF